MPSPVLHSVVGALFARRQSDQSRTASLVVLAALIFAANAPDLDFVAGILVDAPTRFHRGASHSLLATAGFGVLSYLAARLAGYRSATWFGVAMTLAFTSHLLLDMLSPRGDPYRGVELGWPLIDERVSSPYRLFVGVRFDPRSDSFVGGLLRGDYLSHNLYVVATEVVLVAAIWGIRHGLRRFRSPETGRSSFLPSRETLFRARRSRS